MARVGFPTKGTSSSNATGKSKVIKSSTSIPGKAAGGSTSMFGKQTVKAGKPK